MIGRPAVSFADGLLNAGNGGTFYAILVIMAFLSFFICDAFCDLYAVGIDTVLLCFLEDKRYNDGSMMKPYKANPTLKKFMHKYAAGSGQGSVKHPGTGHAIPCPRTADCVTVQSTGVFRHIQHMQHSCCQVTFARDEMPDDCRV